MVSDHGWSGAGKDDADRREAPARRLGVAEHGSGTIPLVLLHGWPQTSYAWRHVVPLLAPDCRTLACDLPGIGSSDPAAGQFDKWSISGDLHASLGQRGIPQNPLVVGHGMGAQVAYAYLRRYPAQVRGVMVLDTPIAGVGGCEDLFTSAAFWHVGFHQTMQGGTGLADLLIATGSIATSAATSTGSPPIPGASPTLTWPFTHTDTKGRSGWPRASPFTGRSRSTSPATSAIPPPWTPRSSWH